MFQINGQFVFAPSDLTNAVQCEFGLLRALDVKLGRLEPLAVVPDLMLERAARLGDAHEERVLAQLLARYGEYDPSAHTGVFQVERVLSRDPGVIGAAAAKTLDVLRSGADVVYQAAFLRGRFNGFADFLIRDRHGAYAVYDSKLARHAKVTALLQLAAYGDELIAHGIDVAPQVFLILGDHTEVGYDLIDLIPVYKERRARLEDIVDQHLDEGGSIVWNDPRVVACGRCDACTAEVEAHRDLLLVANMRSTQRATLMNAGIDTIEELAAGSSPVDGIRARVLESLRSQAAMQLRQQGPIAPVLAEVFNPAALAVIPPPDPGDIFFDFEGDPLWSDSDVSVTGLEYLFGVVEVDTGRPVFRPFWAHDRGQEKQALTDFLTYVESRRVRFPGLHIYHYAAYEKSALLRLAGRYGIGEEIVDTLLRQQVLVDLYSVVRAGVRVSQPSYSLKKLEPLYMGSELRTSEVKSGGESIVAYANYCRLVEAGRTADAALLKAEIADYNEYDCVSTLRLRNWLVGHANDLGVPLTGATIDPDREALDDGDPALAARLVAFVEDGPPLGRTPEQHAIALLAAAVGYHQREQKPFWWGHFDRLASPVEEWADTGDVLIAERVEVVAGWSKTGRQNERRRIRFVGRLAVGSQLKVGSKPLALYDISAIPDGFTAAPGHRGQREVTVLAMGVTAEGLDELEVLEVCARGISPYATLPMALVPGRPITSVNQQRAIRSVAAQVAGALEAGEDAARVLTAQPALQLLARQAPRLTGSTMLPTVIDDDYIGALTVAVADLDGSYLAVQGPPGSGKTYVGARVIAALAARGWRIGVVAQSHKVIENVLRAVAAAGVDSADMGKMSTGAPTPVSWTDLTDASFAPFLDSHAGGGCVVGGTAWDFTNLSRVEAGCLDLMVIDEAGQFCLANTIAVSTAAKRLLLLGDPQQLPQVSQGTHPEPCDDSALSWVIEGHRVMPPDRGYFLAITWRMHPSLTEVVSRYAYDNELRSNVARTAARRLDGVDPGLSVIEVEHYGNSVQSAEEAEAILGLVTALLGRSWKDNDAAPRPLAETDILVVAPFNAQVSMIRRQLDLAGFPDVATGSVDRFQGQEAAVVIVSMTASAPEDVPRGMDFLLSRNRVNVAISRGKWCAIVVRSPRLTDYLPSSPSGLGRLGAFISLCQ